MKKVYRVFIPIPKISSKVYALDSGYTLEEICNQAGVKLKVTGAISPPILLLPEDNAIALGVNGERVYTVDTRNIDFNYEEAWQIILETLAYGFCDYAARESLS
jgi:hypothetical protein